MLNKAVRSTLQSLWNHTNFVKLWSAHTVSQFGTQISILALPLTAAMVLHASPFQMGVLTAMSTLPNLCIGLLAGAWVDRWPKRPVLILADVLRFMLLLVVPILALTDDLLIELLYSVAFLIGTATLFFDLAAQSYLPILIGRTRLMEGNAKLEASRSAAVTIGPSLAGMLVQVMSAPLALLCDAVTFLSSALFLAALPQTDPPRMTTEVRMWTAIQEGLGIVWHNTVLRTIFRTATLWNFFTNVIQSVLLLFTTQSLHLSPGQLGLAFSMLGLGMLPGTALAGPLRRRIGAGPALIASGLFAASSGLVIVLAGVIGGAASLPLLMLANFIYGAGPMVFGIITVSLRQAVTPNHLQGRVSATIATVSGGALPLGALTGGIMGTTLGLLPTIAVGACGMLAAVALLLLSSIRELHEVPTVE